MKTASLAIICIAVLGITLTLGLWPFHAPRNEVTWLGNHEGLRFARHSTVLSSSPLPSALPNGTDGSLEIWLQPGRTEAGGTLLALYDPMSQRTFSISQSLPDLLLKTAGPGDSSPGRPAKLYVVDVFRKLRPIFITITSGERGTIVYLDGVPVKTTSQFRLSAQAFSGHLVIGDAPGQSDSWPGQLFGLAIYHRELTEQQVLRHYVTWEQKGRPEFTRDDSAAALYLFDEHTGSVVHDKTGSGVDLYIPKTYTVIGQIFLEPVWTEFNTGRGYWSSAFKNIVGFVPFGFCFYAYMATILSIKRATLVTVALGTAVSLTIEILQAYLPTRDSGTTDLITNTLGTWIGAASYNLLAPAVVRIFPWLPFSGSSRMH
jgi:hypothetical protein